MTSKNSNMNSVKVQTENWIKEITSPRPLYMPQPIDNATRETLEKCASVFKGKLEEPDVKLYLGSIFNLTDNSREAIMESAETLSTVGKNDARSAKEIGGHLAGIASESRNPDVVKEAARNVASKYMAAEMSGKNVASEEAVSEAKSIYEWLKAKNEGIRSDLKERMQKNTDIDGFIRY
ncbi:MAG: hypothetical protein KGI06_04920 [Candidatus Micrarchaeota archaeon]|nr:hypothetical protein [Candidatus Micrarchaeota archaeon]